VNEWKLLLGKRMFSIPICYPTFLIALCQASVLIPENILGSLTSAINELLANFCRRIVSPSIKDSGARESALQRRQQANVVANNFNIVSVSSNICLCNCLQCQDIISSKSLSQVKFVF
jgi:hypothetical protein